MNTGLPGTGIGGLFYLLSVAVMIFVELKDYLLKKNGAQNLKLVFEQTFLAASIVSAIFATNTFFSKYVFRRPPPILPTHATLTQQSVYLIQIHPVVVPIALLLSVFVTTQIIYFVLRYKK